MPAADPSVPPAAISRNGSATGRGCLLAVVAIPIAIVLAFASLKLLGAAASDCRAYDAGNRFGLLFFYFPILTVVLWIAFVVPAFVVGFRSARVGIFVGMAIVLVIAYAVAGSASDTIRLYGSLETCPAFVPDWWPWFLPR